MALRVSVIPPLDPNLFTGPSRIQSGVARMMTPTADVAYGEFMSRLYVGTSGDVSIVKWDGTTQVLTNLAAGYFHDINSIMINSSGTTASDIVVGS